MKFFVAFILSPAFVFAADKCVIEEGFDYVGNDLFRLHSVNAFECCSQCQSFASAGCRAYSWTDYEGGTCWLKKGRGTLAVNANVKSGTISSYQFADTCVLEHGIDYEGNDLTSVKARDAGACCSVCEQVPGCRAFSFTSREGGTCWLKSAKSNMVVDTNAVSAQVYVEEPTCGLEVDVEYVGNDIGSTRAAQADDCCSLCEGFGGCRAFSWTEYAGGTCWFKNRKDEVLWEVGVKSGQVLANPEAPSCALENGVEYVGNDIGNASSLSARWCCSICMKTVGCRAFSWTNLSGGTCYLKSKRQNTQAATQIISSSV